MVPVLGHTGKGKTITKIKMSWVTMDLGVVMGWTVSPKIHVEALNS